MKRKEILKGVIRGLGGILFALILSACSWLGLGEFNTQENSQLSEASHANAGETKPPFVLEVSDAINDGSRLKVKARISTVQDWLLSGKEVLRLSGMRDGQVVQEAQASLTDGMGARPPGGLYTLKSETPYEVVLDIPVQGVTDYQMELLWGQEAAPYSAPAKTEQLPKPTLVLKSLQRERNQQVCQASKCGFTYTLFAELFNSGNAEIAHATLGVGLVWVPKQQQLDIAKEIPQNEEHIQVGPLGLGPLQTRTVKLVFEKPVPERDDGAFLPVVRVLEVQ